MYNTVEASTELSPIELYKFYDSDGTIKTYNSGTENIIYLGDTYKPENINSDSVEITDEVEARTLTISLPRKNALVALYQIYAPVDQVWLSIFRKHINDSDEEYVRYWNGQVSGIELVTEYANLICKPIDSAFNRLGLWKSYTSTCQNAVYDANCKVNINLPQYRQTATITSIANGTVLESVEFATWTGFTNPTPPVGLTGTDVPQGWWTNGFIFVPATGESRMVVAHGNEESGVDRSKIIILTAINGLTVGSTVEIIAGCARNLETCFQKFNNVINYGGFPFIPLNNPFQHKIVVNAS